MSRRSSLIALTLVTLFACSSDPSSAPSDAATASPLTTCTEPGDPACRATEYCAFAPDNACGAKGQPGTCKTRPTRVPLIHDPVCGCDGVEYGNESGAAATGMSVERAGPCPRKTAGSRAACGFENLPPCPADEWCVHYDGSCTFGSYPGQCQRRPAADAACDATYEPQCGCDGKTYANPCEAEVAQTSVRMPGLCRD